MRAASNRPTKANMKRPFHVLHAASQSTAGDMTLTACGAKPYVFVDQNIDPGAAGYGKIDPSRIIDAVLAKHGDSPSGFGMLDYENPFDHWIDKGPGTKEHAAATSQMVGAISAVRAAFPKVLWTYYGIPGLSYWPNGKLWVTASPSERLDEQMRQLENYGPVLDACDWYAPCIYDVQRNDTQRPQDTALNAANEVAYRLARIGLCDQHRRMVLRPGRKIIPVVCPFYDSGGNVADLRLIPTHEFVSDQIMPCVAAAGGACIWAATGWMVNEATGKNDTPQRDKLRAFFLSHGAITTGTSTEWDHPQMPTQLREWCSSMLASYAEAARTAADGRPAGKAATNAD